MQFFPLIMLMAIAALAIANPAQAQPPTADDHSKDFAVLAQVQEDPTVPRKEPERTPAEEMALLRCQIADLRAQPMNSQGTLSTEAKEGTGQVAPDQPQTPAEDWVEIQQEIKDLQEKQVLLLAQAKPDDKLKKQIDLQQKQIQTLQKMIRLLAEQMKQLKQQPAGGPAVEKLQTQVATLEARSKQAAQRDQDVANAIDDVKEHVDAQERYGPQLPATLKELFLPTETNESPLSIYGALAFGYSKIEGDSTTAANGAGRPSTPGAFYFGEFTPDFLLKLNDWIFLEAEIGITSNGSVSAGSFAQADFFVNDWLTIIAGRFVAPIGWFNERLNNPWINKLPGDAPGSGPLLWQQVLPAMSLLGVQAQGSFYLGCSPLKLEYNAYISNGLNVTPATAGAPTIDEVANLENMTSTFSSITNDKAMGGRIGLWWPEVGLAGGISGLYNGDYIAGGAEDSISLWAVDLNYHKGNWDVRAEYGMNFQEAGTFGFNNIRRQGFYTQVAYRPRDLPNGFLQKLELIYRYSYVDIRGIDPTTLSLSSYSTPMDVPVRRQQNEFGIDYWFAPRMVLKCAYQINDEPGFHLHDNQFITELAWGW
jgi:hypothetical protein